MAIPVIAAAAGKALLQQGAKETAAAAISKAPSLLSGVNQAVQMRKAASAGIEMELPLKGVTAPEQGPVKEKVDLGKGSDDVKKESDPIELPNFKVIKDVVKSAMENARGNIRNKQEAKTAELAAELPSPLDAGPKMGF